MFHRLNRMTEDEANAAYHDLTVRYEHRFILRLCAADHSLPYTPAAFEQAAKRGNDEAKAVLTHGNRLAHRLMFRRWRSLVAAYHRETAYQAWIKNL